MDEIGREKQNEADGALMEIDKDEVGEYSTATRFGKGKRIYHDKKWTRPVTRQEYLHRIEATRLSNKWDWDEFRRNCEMLNLVIPEYPENTPQDLLQMMTAEQLKLILDDFEKHGMILFQKYGE